MEDDLKKNEMEDNLNFKAVLLSLFNNKNLKKNGFDTIEIDLVSSSLAARNKVNYVFFKSVWRGY
jgi:hypothetical protein